MMFTVMAFMGVAAARAATAQALRPRALRIVISA
jgi:hypothetical protein